jgi:hypothetical protein
MHRAPALSYPLGRSRFQGALVAFTSLSAALVGCLWWLAGDPLDWRHALFALIWFIGLVLAFGAWWRAPVGSLRWDGQGWNWIGAGDPVAGRLTAHLDLQFCLVLSLRPETGRRIWLFPERRRDGMRWNALRRAVFARPAAAFEPAAVGDADSKSR